MRLGHEDRQQKLMRDRDKNVFIGNIVHQQSDMDMPESRVKELHISDGTKMDHMRGAVAQRLEREREARRSKELREEMMRRSKADKLNEFKMMEQGSKRMADDKIELKLQAAR